MNGQRQSLGGLQAVHPWVIVLVIDAIERPATENLVGSMLPHVGPGPETRLHETTKGGLGGRVGIQLSSVVRARHVYFFVVNPVVGPHQMDAHAGGWQRMQGISVTNAGEVIGKPAGFHAGVELGVGSGP